MGRRLAWPSLLLVAACNQDVVAPGVCPEYCPSTRITVIDTLIRGSIERDSSFRGYVLPFEASRLQVTAGGTVQSRGVMRFAPFNEEIPLGLSSGDNRPVVAIDSFRLLVTLSGRTPELADLELVVHRLPVTVDSSSTYGQLEPFFEDTTEVAAVLIPDTVVSDSVGAVLAGDAFPSLESDSLVTALGLDVRSSVAAFVNLRTAEDSRANTALIRYAKVDSADGELAERNDTVRVVIDGAVAEQLPAADPATLSVGGIPSARALLRATLPPSIVDSSSVVRATIILVPAEPALGAPGDSIRLSAEALAADIGPKSPIIPLPTDSLEFASAVVGVGSMDTVRIDITHIVASWRADSTRPRAFMLRVRPEGATLGEIRLASSENLLGAPGMRITFIPSINAN